MARISLFKDVALSIFQRRSHSKAKCTKDSFVLTKHEIFFINFQEVKSNKSASFDNEQSV